MLPTAKGLGSTRLAAPNFQAAATPAPYFISPWVRVGPSSTTRTRLPVIAPGVSTVKGEAASMTTALGLIERMLERTFVTPSAAAASILLMTMQPARYRLVVPGW